MIFVVMNVEFYTTWYVYGCSFWFCNFILPEFLFFHIGLQTLLLLLEKIRQSDINQEFYERFYLITLKDVLFVITSEKHTSGICELFCHSILC